MELQQKPDFEKVLKRFEAWWRCEILDRPPVSIGVKRRKPGKPYPPKKQYATLRERWMDTERRLDCFEAGLEGVEYVGDSFPWFNPNLGPEITGTLFGCELEFTEGTSWASPVARNCRQIIGMKPNFENVYWRKVREMTEQSLQRGAGRWITGLTDIHTNGDLLASLREPQSLAMEMADDIDAVAAACQYVTDLMPAIYEDLYKLIAAAGQPASTWVPAPYRGKMYVTSCDFICMISPAMFRRTILPCLVREMKYLDVNIYHLDGPNALPHLDDLLAIPELNGIQWIYGAGKGPASKWPDVYRRVQKAGKNLQIVCESIEDAEKIMEILKPEGTWFCVGQSYPHDVAEAFVQHVERWGAKRE